jgi:predicted RNA-binding protein
MCEFRVYLDGVEVWEDVIYAVSGEGRVVLRDVMGEERVFEGVEIVEVDVASTRLVLRGH